MPPLPRDEWVVLGGMRFHYRSWTSSGPSVVLLHGLASTCHIWDLVAPILGADLAVVALDQRGHGESAKPNDGYDFATVTGDLHRFIQALGLARPVVVGHSWGGDVALEYAVAYPQVPRGLCLVDGGTIEISASPGLTLQQAKEDMAPPDFTGLTLEQLRERARSWHLGPRMTPQLEEIVLANFEVLGDGSVRARLSRDNHMQVVEALWDHRPSALYPRVVCPVLLMPARRRGDRTATARRLRRKQAIATAAEELPVSKTVWLEDSIHDVPLQRPELVAGVIVEHLQGGFFG